MGDMNNKKLKAQSYYDIEFRHQPHPKNEGEKWGKLPSFSYMRKSFAEGAWAMLRAHYNQRSEHRLMKNGEEIDRIGTQKVKLN